jgi:hypothetical protein
LRSWVPDEQLQSILLLTGAAKRIKFNRHPTNGRRENHPIVGEPSWFVGVVALHPGIVRSW